MRKVILAVSCMAVAAYASQAFNADDDYYPSLAQWESLASRKVDTYEISVDWESAEKMGKSIAKKFDDYNKMYKKETKKEAQAVEKALGDAYKNTMAKIIMDFGDTVAPLLEHTGEVLEVISTNSSCNSTCAVRCWRDDKADKINDKYVFGFNRTCFKNCKCDFKFDKWSKEQEQKFLKKVGKLEDDIEELAKFGDKLAKEARDTVVPALEKFGKKAAELQDEYLETVNKAAVEDLGCNKTCVNKCTNGKTTCFWELSDCISKCSCTKVDGIVDISHGTYNYPQLVLYAKGNMRTWNFFKENKNFI